MSESMYDEITRRIDELERDDWMWIKHEPNTEHTMCAVYDYRAGRYLTLQRLSERTVTAIDRWIRTTRAYTYKQDWNPEPIPFTGIVDYNDNENGAESVSDVIQLLEKFRAEL